MDKEIENCRFLSIQIDETTDVSTKEVSETFLLVLIDPTFPWLLVYEIQLQNRIDLIAYYYHVLLLNIGFKRS